MDIHRRLAAAALAAITLGSLATALRAAAPLDPRYNTACVIVAPTTAEGFVTNGGSTPLQVAGPVRFVFVLFNSMSRPTATVQTDVIIPPGQTMSIGRTTLVGNLVPSEVCQLDISTAVR